MEKTELVKKIGDNIRELRKKKGISQAELARRCFKDKQALEKIENGKVNSTIYSLYLIAKALDIELEELIKLEKGETF